MEGALRYKEDTTKVRLTMFGILDELQKFLYSWMRMYFCLPTCC